MKPVFQLSNFPLFIVSLIVMAAGAIPTTPCQPTGEYWDSVLLQCFPCSTDPCYIGTYRETCTQYSTADAACIPCTPNPPPHAEFISGGLPYNFNGCQWACSEGFFLDKNRSLGLPFTPMCSPCTRALCPPNNIQIFTHARERCPLGSTKDAECVQVYWPPEPGSLPFNVTIDLSRFLNYSAIFDITN